MNKLLIKTKIAKDSFMSESKRVLKNTKGDQITGWLIVILIVVVVKTPLLRSGTVLSLR